MSDHEEESKASVVDAKELAEYDHWMKVERMTFSLTIPIILCVGVLAGLYYMDGTHFSRGALGAVVVVSLGAFVWVISNFRPAKSVRIVREVVWLLVLFIAAFLLHCGGLCAGTAGAAVSRAARVLCTPIVLIFVIAGFDLSCVIGYALDRRKFIRKGTEYREKRMKHLKNWFGRRVDAFLGRHPSLVVSSMKEYVFLSVRYAAWVASLSFLVSETYALVRRLFV